MGSGGFEPEPDGRSHFVRALRLAGLESTGPLCSEEPPSAPAGALGFGKMQWVRADSNRRKTRYTRLPGLESACPHCAEEPPSAVATALGFGKMQWVRADSNRNHFARFHSLVIGFQSADPFLTRDRAERPQSLDALNE